MHLKRRHFLKVTSSAMLSMMLSPALIRRLADHGLSISLAEWSFHRALQSGEMDHLDFPLIAKRDYNIAAVEYVNGFFGGKKMNFKVAAKNKPYLNELLKRSKDAGVVNHLIMIDDEGPLAVLDGKERMAAIENHKKWIDAAKFLGCKTMRVNLHGEAPREDKKFVSIDSLSKLGELAGPDLNVVVENHGHESSDGGWLVEVMKGVNKQNVGTLPDFGNFCLTHPWGETQSPCEKMYDRYQGVRDMLPYAKGVSAKSYDFDANGDQPLMDYKRLLDIVKKSGFRGYIGIEYEGNTQPEDEGVRKTLALLEKHL